MKSVPANSEPVGERAAGTDRLRAAIVVAEGLALFEFGVACDVFGIDRVDRFGRRWYTLDVCAARRGPVTTDAKLSLVVPNGLRPLRHAGTIIVPPTEFPDRVPDAVLAELRRAHRRGARIMSLCTGAFVLAAAGLLDGRRVTTHWEEAGRLAHQARGAQVDLAPLYVEDDDILTSAGSAASIDLCLHVVRQDFGAEVATQLARELVVPLHREGDQAQYVADPIPTLPDEQAFVDTLRWAQTHLGDRVSVEDMARRSAMSPRTFARHFRQAVGTTPHRWIVT